MSITTPTKARFSVTLCADDFALSPGVNRGVLEALTKGRLSAVSAMTTEPYWAVGAAELRPFQTQADIGLHLNLTLGGPLGKMPVFAPSGRFPPIGQLLKAALKRELPQAEIGAEIARQIDAFGTHFGQAPAFIDGHQHIHVLPQIRAELFGCLEGKRFPGTLWLRDCADGLARILMRFAPELKKTLTVAWLARGFAQEAAAHGFATNDGFAGFSAFDAGRDYARDFWAYLRAPGRRHLIMCHPGYVDEVLRAADPVTESRERELAFLLSPDFPKMLERLDARLAKLSKTLTVGNTHS